MRSIVYSGLIILASMLAAAFLSLLVVDTLAYSDEMAWYTSVLVSPSERLAARIDSDALDARSPGELAAIGEDFGVVLAVLDDDTLAHDFRDDAAQILDQLGTVPNSTAVIEVNRQDEERFFAFRRLRDGRILALGIRGEPPPNTFIIALFALSTGLLAAIITSLAVFGPMVRRLRVLEETARAIQAGDLSRRATVEGGDAIGRFAHRFNMMAEQLDYHVKRQEETLAAISHELRTPISRIRFSLELFAQTTDPAKRQHYEERLDADLFSLDSLIDELLEYAQFLASPPEMKKTRFNIVSEIEELAAVAAARFVDIHVELDVADGTLCAERRQFHRVMSNLIENALRFAESKVTIRSTNLQDRIVIDVINDGPLIPEGHRETVFEAFHRVDSCRSRHSGGVGLGLWIVRQVMRAHGGVVTCGTTVQHETCFSTEWPHDSIASKNHSHTEC